MQRLFIPACLCLVTIGSTTTIGPQTPRPIEPIITSAHTKNKGKSGGKVRPKSQFKGEADGEPGATFAERLAPFAAALQAPPADSPQRSKLAAAMAANAPQANVYAAVARSNHQANPLADPSTSTAILVPVQTVSIPARPTPSTPASVRKRVVYRSQREICDTVAKAAHSNNLPVPFFIRLLFQESRFDAASLSHAGAQGIAQFTPETAADVGLNNPFDPRQAIPAAAQLLRDFVDRFGNLGLAAAAYNAGPTRVDNWLKRGSRLPAETRGYVKTVTGKSAETWRSGKEVHSKTALPKKTPCKPVSEPYAIASAASVPLPASP